MSTPEIYINSVSAAHMNHNKYRSSLEQSCIAANLHHLSNQKRKSARKTSHESCDTAATTEESPLELHHGYSHHNLNILSDDDNRRSSSSSVQPQTESLNSFKSGNKSKKNSLLDTNKYKTEMCKKWQAVGSCPYGKKCRFAHGRDELHDKILSNKKKYKSERCQSFYTTMTCPYGSRCLFAHEERCLKDLLADHQKILTDSNLKRLPCFAKLKSDDNSYNDALLMKTLEKEMDDILSFTQ